MEFCKRELEYLKEEEEFEYFLFYLKYILLINFYIN